MSIDRRASFSSPSAFDRCPPHKMAQNFAKKLKGRSAHPFLALFLLFLSSKKYDYKTTFPLVVVLLLRKGHGRRRALST
jgi:hypothetical protein